MISIKVDLSFKAVSAERMLDSQLPNTGAPPPARVSGALLAHNRLIKFTS